MTRVIRWIVAGCVAVSPLGGQAFGWDWWHDHDDDDGQPWPFSQCDDDDDDGWDDDGHWWWWHHDDPPEEHDTPSCDGLVDFSGHGMTPSAAPSICGSVYEAATAAELAAWDGASDLRIVDAIEVWSATLETPCLVEITPDGVLWLVDPLGTLTLDAGALIVDGGLIAAEITSAGADPVEIHGAVQTTLGATFEDVGTFWLGEGGTMTIDGDVMYVGADHVSWDGDTSGTARADIEFFGNPGFRQGEGSVIDLSGIEIAAVPSTPTGELCDGTQLGCGGVGPLAVLGEMSAYVIELEANAVGCSGCILTAEDGVEVLGQAYPDVVQPGPDPADPCAGGVCSGAGNVVVAGGTLTAGSTVSVQGTGRTCVDGTAVTADRQVTTLSGGHVVVADTTVDTADALFGSTAGSVWLDSVTRTGSPVAFALNITEVLADIYCGQPPGFPAPCVPFEEYPAREDAGAITLRDVVFDTVSSVGLGTSSFLPEAQFPVLARNVTVEGGSLAGGEIEMKAFGGDVEVTDVTLTAGEGIEVDTEDGDAAIEGATLSSATVTFEVLGDVSIDGTTITASDSVELATLADVSVACSTLAGDEVIVESLYGAAQARNSRITTDSEGLVSATGVSLKDVEWSGQVWLLESGGALSLDDVIADVAQEVILFAADRVEIDDTDMWAGALWAELESEELAAGFSLTDSSLNVDWQVILEQDGTGPFVVADSVVSTPGEIEVESSGSLSLWRADVSGGEVELDVEGGPGTTFDMHHSTIFGEEGAFLYHDGEGPLTVDDTTITSPEEIEVGAFGPGAIDIRDSTLEGEEVAIYGFGGGPANFEESTVLAEEAEVEATSVSATGSTFAADDVELDAEGGSLSLAHVDIVATRYATAVAEGGDVWLRDVYLRGEEVNIYAFEGTLYASAVDAEALEDLVMLADGYTSIRYSSLAGGIAVAGSNNDSATVWLTSITGEIVWVLAGEGTLNLWLSRFTGGLGIFDAEVRISRWFSRFDFTDDCSLYQSGVESSCL